MSALPLKFLLVIPLIGIFLQQYAMAEDPAFESSGFRHQEILLGNSVYRADFTGDGNIDFITTLDKVPGWGSSLWINHGNGIGGFSPPVPLSRYDGHIRLLGAIDLEGDGDIDLIGQSLSERLVISHHRFINQGNGSFLMEPMDQDLPMSSRGVVFPFANGDFNGDQLDDLVFHTSGGLLLWQNKGNGGFTENPISITDQEFLRLKTIDWDSDKISDLIVGNSKSKEVQLRFGGFKDGFLGPPIPLVTIPEESSVYRWGYFFHDLDKDGSLDLLLYTPTRVLTYIFQGEEYRFFQELSLGTLEAPLSLDVLGDQPLAVDFDRDGKMEIIGTTEDGGFVIFKVELDGKLTIDRKINNFRESNIFKAYLDQVGTDGIILTQPLSVHSGSVLSITPGKDGTIVPPKLVSLNEKVRQITIKDVDGDGLLDVVFIAPGKNIVQVRIGKKTNTYEPWVEINLPATPTEIVVGDINKDGLIDIAAVTPKSDQVGPTLHLIPQTIHRTFPNSISYPLPTEHTELTLGDLNHDGSQELISVSSDGRILILSGERDDVRTMFETVVPHYPQSVHTGDFTGDQLVDIAFIGRVIGKDLTTELVILPGKGDRTFGNPIRTNPNRSFEFPKIGQLTPLDADGDGDLDLALAGNYLRYINQTGRMHLFMNDGLGNFSYQDSTLLGFVEEYWADYEKFHWVEVFPSPDLEAPIFGVDLDGDGREEILRRYSEGVQIYTLGKNGKLAIKDIDYWCPGTLHNFVDIDKDGDKDLISTNKDNGMICILTRSGASSRWQRGDANKDGDIDLVDTVAILEYLFAGKEEGICKDAGDFDNNGAIDITDAVSIALFLFSSGMAPDNSTPVC